MTKIMSDLIPDLDPELTRAILENEKDNENRPINLIDNEFWQVISDPALLTTNCIMPKHLLGRAIQANIMPPLFFKITNPETNQYVICAAENFFDTEDQENLVILPSIIQTQIGCNDLVSIEVINRSPDLIPAKAKTVFLEPQDELFYSIENPEKLLEACFSQSYFIGKDYLIPLPYRGSQVMIKINLIADDKGHELKFGNINNIDLNVEFVPIPDHLRKPPSPQPSLISSQPQEEPETAPNHGNYDPKKKWVPFCGSGHRLSDGAKFSGRSQDDK